MNKCTFCDKEFEKKSTLNRHLTTARFCLKLQLDSNKNIQKKMFNCPSCNKELTSKARLNYHLNICNENKIQLHESKIDKANSKLENLQKTLLEITNKTKEIEEKIEINNDKKYKKKPIPKTLKMSVWYTHIGKEIGMVKCPCCNSNEISQMDFDCGHVIAESKGGPMTIENLKPICNKCNRSMRTMNMNEFKQKYFK